MKRYASPLGAACILAALFVWQTSAREVPRNIELRTSETLLSTLEPTCVAKSIAISPDMRHVAYLDDVGKAKDLIVDGKYVTTYRDIEPTSLRYSPDSKRLAYVATSDGGRISIAETDEVRGRSHQTLHAVGGTLDVVVDGAEYPGFSAVDLKSLVFSPDSRKLAFVAQKGNGGWQLYLDGAESVDRYDDVACLATAPTVRFSPDSQHVAFAAVRNARWLVVVDGKPGAEYDAILDDTIVFSPDSSRIAYAVRRGGHEMVLLDESEQPEYISITEGSLAFSPDGRRFGYLATRSNGHGGPFCLAVVDGVPGEEVSLDDAGSPRPSALHPERLRFSPDGNRYAWALRHLHEASATGGAESGVQLIVDELVSPEFRSLLSDFHFSPDGRHLAYVAAMPSSGPSSDDVRLVVDSRQGRPYHTIDYASVCFSPDGRYAAYIGRKSYGRPRLVVNDAESTLYVDIVAVAPYGQVLTPPSHRTEVIFTGPRSVAYVANVGRRILRLNTTIVEK